MTLMDHKRGIHGGKKPLSDRTPGFNHIGKISKINQSGKNLG